MDAQRSPILIAIAAVIVLGVAIASHRWLVPAAPFDGGFGLRSAELCIEGQCQTMTNAEIVGFAAEGDPDAGLFTFTGYAALIAGLLGIGGIIGTVVVVARDRRRWIPFTAIATTIVLLAGELAAWIFVRSQPPGLDGEIRMSSGWSFWAYGAGAIGGIIAVQLLLASVRPAPEST